MTRFVTLSLFFLFGNLLCPAQDIATARLLKSADSLYTRGDYKNARPLYQKALRNGEPNALEWNRYAYSDYKLGHGDDALASFQKALTFHPAGPLKGVIHLRMARIYSWRKELVTMYVQIDSAIANQYVNITEMDTLSEFNPVRSDVSFKKRRDRLYAIVYPCRVDPVARAFDFWAGEWAVYVTGTKTWVGNNKIEIIADGCGLLENWINGNNREGKSINFVAANGKWKQSWVGGGNEEFVDGEYRGNAMRFTFATVDVQGKETPGRFTFFNEGPDQVRQFKEISSDGGKSWSPVYDFTCIRKK